MRLNPRAFERCLKTDGSLTNFWKYDTTGSVSYDATTQLPTISGELIQANADVMNFSINEIKNSGGLIDVNSKKYIVTSDIELEKGDEVLNNSLVEIYRIIEVIQFANRKHLYAVKPLDNPNTH